MTSYDILPIIKVILLFTYCMVKIIFREIWMILVTENLFWVPIMRMFHPEILYIWGIRQFGYHQKKRTTVRKYIPKEFAITFNQEKLWEVKIILMRSSFILQKTFPRTNPLHRKLDWKRFSWILFEIGNI